MRRLLLAFLAVALACIAVIVIRTARFKSLQPPVQRAATEQPLPGAAERLAGAIRIPTVSHSDSARRDAQAFAALHAYLTSATRQRGVRIGAGCMAAARQVAPCTAGYRHGHAAREAIAMRRYLAALVREAREMLTGAANLTTSCPLAGPGTDRIIDCMRTLFVLAITLVGRSLVAQPPRTWAAAIAQTVGAERPLDKPEIDARCSGDAVEFPDSLALVNARFARRPDVWVRWPNDTKGHWKALPTPTQADTFHVRVAGLACGLYGGIILEHDNHFLRVDHPSGNPDSPFYLLAAGVPTEPAIFAWSCR